MPKKTKIIIGTLAGFIIAAIVALFFILKPNESTFTVTFDANGGSSIAPVVVSAGETIEAPTKPKKSGYLFYNWCTDASLNTRYDFSTPINQDITLYAKWIISPDKSSKEEDTKEDIPTEPPTDTPQEQTSQKPSTPTPSQKPTPAPEPTKPTYTVSFNTDGGSVVAAQKVTEGNKVAKPANPSKNGYTFVEWRLDGKAYNFNTAISKNITMVAAWRALATYTVSFNTNGAGIIASQNIQEGSKATKPANPTKEGYNFVAWQLNGQNFDFNSKITGNITLTAKWSQKTYTVKVSTIDQYSPDRILTVYEDGTKVNVSSIKYNGITLCTGNNMVVNMYEIEGITTVTVILNGGTSVTANVN